MIAISAMNVLLYPLNPLSDAQTCPGTLADEDWKRKRLQGATPLGDGEDHQAKTSEEYSTEYCGCQRRACFLVHNVHPPALQHC